MTGIGNFCRQTVLFTISCKPLQLDVGYERQSLIKLLTERGFNNEVKIIEKFYTKETES